MIEHELLLLGLLKERPQHGYEIKKKIREIISLFAGVELKSVYYPLQVLERRGLLAKHINKKGRRPKRLVYALTPKGEARFQQLLGKSFLDFKRPQFSLDLDLYFLRYLKPRMARRRLRGRIFLLKKLSSGLTGMVKNLKAKKYSLPLVRILEHNLRMLAAEVEFLADLTKNL